MTQRKIADMLLMVIIGALIATGTKLKEKPDDVETAISPRNMLGLRGLMCAMVIISHATFTFGDGRLYSIGTPCVAMFFFLSGYGICLSYEKNPELYAAGFPRKRLLYLTMTCLFANIIFWAVIHVLFPGQPPMFGLWDAIRTCDVKNILVLLDKYRGPEWFIDALLVMCAFTYIGMRIAKKDARIVCLAAMIGAAVWISLNIDVNTGYNTTYRWTTTHMFPVGMLFAIYRGKIWALFNRRPKTIAALAVTGIVTTAPYFYQWPWLQSIFAVCTTVLLIIVSTRVSFRGKLLQAIGIVSLEAYLFQTLFTNQYPAANAFLRQIPYAGGVLCVVCSILTGALANKILKPPRIKLCKRNA